MERWKFFINVSYQDLRNIIIYITKRITSTGRTKPINQSGPTHLELHFLKDYEPRMGRLRCMWSGCGMLGCHWPRHHRLRLHYLWHWWAGRCQLWLNWLVVCWPRFPTRLLPTTNPCSLDQPISTFWCTHG